MDIRTSLEGLFSAAFEAARIDGSLDLDCVPEAALERPRDENNGDWASTVAMRLAKSAHKSPREVARIIVDHFPENNIIATLEIAGPGFINIRLSNSTLQDVVRLIRDEKENYGKSSAAEDIGRVNLEYVSANPTGPMHVGHGRWAALGDATARVMRHAGYNISEEFYINDHGTQMDNFAESVVVRYQQLLGCDAELPEACYAGEYVFDIARKIIEEDGDRWLDAPADERHRNFRERAYRMMLDEQHRLCDRLGVHFDCWFSERDLYKPDSEGKSAVDRALEAMKEKGYVYDKDGATWFNSTAFGDDKDRVLIKANGEYTYFTSDMAYHYNKLERGFSHLIDIWGADHHGYVARCKAMLAAWGYPDVLEVILGQLVNLFRDGKPVRMSKRTGEMVTFEELVDEVGVDATRFLMLSQSSDQAIDFDIDLAKKKDAANPVYYVQYAHARICSVLRKAAEQALSDDIDVNDLSVDQLVERTVVSGADLSLLTHESELALIRKMADFPEFVSKTARDRAAFRLTHYAQELAALFHSFYTNCRILGVEDNLRDARLALVDASRIVLSLTLSLLGVSAPAKM